jgi:hypothetical protein
VDDVRKGSLETMVVTSRSICILKWLQDANGAALSVGDLRLKAGRSICCEIGRMGSIRGAQDQEE